MESEVEEAVRFLSEIPATWVEGYEWPATIRDQLSDAIVEIDFDRQKLLASAVAARSSHFLVPFLTAEYFDLGLLWVEFALRAGVTAFAIAAGDEETADQLARRSIPHFRVHLPTRLTTLRQFSNKGGFDGKALGVIFTRHHVIRFLVEAGYGAVSCDIDAVLLRNPMQSLRDADIVFQRVAYFPKVTAFRWGFSACGGFIACAPSAAAACFLRKVTALQRGVSSDQLAWNLALVSTGVVWDETHSYSGREELIAGFGRDADRSFTGRVPALQLSVEALPATTFWRHGFVPVNLARTVLAHPNSPKSPLEKLAILQRVIGARYRPSHFVGV